MNEEYNYIVWVGGSEIGHYTDQLEAEEVYDSWVEKGYEDVSIEELDVTGEETPSETNEWLRSAGY